MRRARRVRRMLDFALPGERVHRYRTPYRGGGNLQYLGYRGNVLLSETTCLIQSPGDHSPCRLPDRHDGPHWSQAGERWEYVS